MREVVAMKILEQQENLRSVQEQKNLRSEPSNWRVNLPDQPSNIF